METVVNHLAALVAMYKTSTSDHQSEQIEDTIKRYLPSGSGIDAGVKLDLDESTGDRLVFTFGYHHMNQGGYYSGWSAWTLIVTASLAHGFTMDLNGVEDGLDLIEVDDEGNEYSDNEFAIETTGEYLGELFQWSLDQPFQYSSQIA